jgi:hypothetical protein
VFRWRPDDVLSKIEAAPDTREHFRLCLNDLQEQLYRRIDRQRKRMVDVQERIRHLEEQMAMLSEKLG